MDNLKDIRWKQRFENFDKSYKLLNKYAKQPITTELERAGIIQFFEMTYFIVNMTSLFVIPCICIISLTTLLVNRFFIFSQNNLAILLYLY